MTNFITGDEDKTKSIRLVSDGSDVNIECDNKLVAWFKGDSNELVVEEEALKSLDLKLSRN